MFCFIYQSLISHAADSNKPLTPRVQKHLQRCPRCAQFHHTTTLLTQQLPNLAQKELTKPSPQLTQKIQSALNHQPTTTLTFPKRRHILRPALTAAATILIITSITLVINHRQTQSTTTTPNLADILTLQNYINPNADAQSTNTANINQLVDSPLQTELLALKAQTKAAANTLLAPFMIQLEEDS